MAITFTNTAVQKFHVVTCYTCGVPFGITAEIYRRVVTDAEGSVYCPVCGKKTCWRESSHQKEAKRLKAEIESANRRADTQRRRAEKQEQLKEKASNQLRATKGVVTRMKNRIGKGVCPCCNRSFSDLHRHMKTKHPEYASSEGDE